MYISTQSIFLPNEPIIRSIYFYILSTFIPSLPREAFNKKTVKFGNCSQIAGDPPTLAYLGIRNCYFLLVILAY